MGMTMLSFRVEDEDATAVDGWAQRLGVDRSQLLRDALRQHLTRLAGEVDSNVWAKFPLDDDERSFAAVADWGPAEDWSDWSDAAR